MAFKYAIALTGGIATGKSSAGVFLRKLGFTMIDADLIAHEVLDEQYLAIGKMFGNTLLMDKKVDRKALGSIVFNDELKRKKLETLLHPLIYEKIKNLAYIEDEKEKPYFVDIPLFFESTRYPIEKSLLIYVSAKLQLERLMRRDKLNTKEAQQRIDSQMSIEEKVCVSTYVIDNSATLRELEDACVEIGSRIMKDFK